MTTKAERVYRVRIVDAGGAAWIYERGDDREHGSRYAEHLALYKCEQAWAAEREHRTGLRSVELVEVA